MNNAELKPCPFCGSNNVELVDEFEKRTEHRYLTYRRVGCNDCGALSGRRDNRTECIERWNRRVNDA